MIIRYQLQVSKDLANINFVFQLKRRTTYLIFSCLRSWSRQLPIEVKVFSQIPQVNGFSPVWVRRWTYRLPFSAKILWQSSNGHSWRPSKKCFVLLCINNLFALAKDLTQSPISHECLTFYLTFILSSMFPKFTISCAMLDSSPKNPLDIDWSFTLLITLVVIVY